MLQSTILPITLLKILIVDDNAANVMILEKMLRIHGYQSIASLTDPRLVQDTMRADMPDLLLLDLKMPYLDGFAILDWIRNTLGNTTLPIIIITAQSDSENKIKALRLGAQDFVGKPFDHTEVLTRIHNLLHLKLLHNQLQENNLLLEQKVQKRTEDIKNLQIELVERLTRAAEFRDVDTGNHIARIGEYTYLLSKKLGFSEEDATMICNASKMHDIGKVAIPDHILLKPAKLSPDEMAIMKTHAQKGAQILAGSQYQLIQIAEQIAYTHHEKWDGSGYPRGLTHDEIPLVGRMTALVDVFDALISERPYKQAWPLEQVLAYIKLHRGTHFDPQLVDILLDSIQSFVFIYQKYTEVKCDEKP